MLWACMRAFSPISLVSTASTELDSGRHWSPWPGICSVPLLLIFFVGFYCCRILDKDEFWFITEGRRYMLIVETYSTEIGSFGPPHPCQARCLSLLIPLWIWAISMPFFFKYNPRHFNPCNYIAIHLWHLVPGIPYPLCEKLTLQTSFRFLPSHHIPMPSRSKLSCPGEIIWLSIHLLPLNNHIWPNAIRICKDWCPFWALSGLLPAACIPL